MKVRLAAIALLLATPATAEAADRCGRSSVPSGEGSLELSLWQAGTSSPSEGAILTIPARGDRFVMVLHYTPARGRMGAPDWVQVYVYAPWQLQVRHGDVLRIDAGAAHWQGASPITGIHSRSQRPGVAALYSVAGGMQPVNPALIRALATGGEVRLVREPKGGSSVEDVVDLPRPQGLDTAYRAARRQAVAALGACPPPVAEPVSAP